MTLIIERLNGDKYNLKEMGIRVVQFEPESPNILSEIIDIDGGGVIVQDRGYGARFINAEFLIHNHDLVDYAVFRSDLFKLFSTNEKFYITDTKEPFKRWLVKTDGSFSLSRAIKTGTFNINFITVRLFAESVLSSSELEIMQNGGNIKEWDIDIWTWNSGIDWDTEYKYSHTTREFDIINVGDVGIDPTKWPLKITIKATATNSIGIRNKTNGDIYQYFGTLNSNDTLIIDGVRSFKNNNPVFGDTNHNLISLEPGVNSFVITGAVVNEISFDFRYPYK